MLRFAVVLVSLIAGHVARAGYLAAPLTSATFTPTAAVGPDGRVLDTPEVAVARAEHVRAHVNERIRLANEAAGIASLDAVPGVVRQVALGAPVGPGGKVVDTPEVAVARAEHAAAHANERANLANEAARSAGDATEVTGGEVVPVLQTTGVLSSVVPVTGVGPDGRVLDTPEVAAAKAAHAAAHVNEKINLANEAARSEGLVSQQILSVVATNGPAASVGPDGRVVDTPEVAYAKAAHAIAHLNEKASLVDEGVRSADVLAVAGPAVAYGRLVY